MKVFRQMKNQPEIPIVRAVGQFGMLPKYPKQVKLFLDDARNPPVKERDWVVVRTVDAAKALVRAHGSLITECSLDNDLGPDPQGIDFLKWVMVIGRPNFLPNLHTVTIHTGNLRKMMALLRMTDLKAVRRVPHDRIYPRLSNDTRKIKVYST
jgi:hypothetical protein